MAFVFGTSTNYQTFADVLSNVAMGTSLQSVTSVAAGGTGYVVGDVLTISGGTNTIAATVEVLTIGGGGAVTAVRVRNAGLYQTTPSNPASTTGGTGTSCTLNLSFGTNGWQRRRAINVVGAAQSATIGAGGTGYAVGNTVTISGGTFTSAATFRVDTIGGGGAVTAVSVVNPGNYTVTPGNPAATTGGAGSSLTLNVTYGTSGEREIILEGAGSGSDQIFVGWQSYFDSGSGARNLELAGFTGFDRLLIWDNQPGISPGRNTTTGGGAFVPLSNTTVTWWIAVTARRIIFVAKIGTCYSNGYLGFLNPFATAGEWPYPLYVCGTTTDRFALSSGSAITTSGIGDPQAVSPSDTGPGNVRTADGTWKSVFNSSGSGTRTQRANGVTTYPGGRTTSPSITADDNFVTFGSTGSWNENIPETGSPTGTQNIRLLRTTNSGGDLVITIPFTLTESTGGSVPVSILGELDGAWWFDAASVIVPENRLTISTDRYTVFQEGVRSDNWALWALKES